MVVEFASPHDFLKPFVRGYFQVELEAMDLSQPLDIHPLGFHTMAVTLNAKAAFGSANGDYDFNVSFHGYICKHISLIPLTSSVKMIVVSFTETGASQLFNMPQRDTINQILPIDEAFAGSTSLIEGLERIGNDVQVATAIIDDWLLQQIPHQTACQRHASNIANACSVIKARQGKLLIRDLCKEVGLSQTYLEDHFKDMIGTSPKLYSRIERFIAAYQFILQRTHVHWSELVFHYDFFDQSHFIHEFKTFFGYSPSRIHVANCALSRKIIASI